jgi:hypothetical protein
MRVMVSVGVTSEGSVNRFRPDQAPAKDGIRLQDFHRFQLRCAKENDHVLETAHHGSPMFKQQDQNDQTEDALVNYFRGRPFWRESRRRRPQTYDNC